MAGKKLKSNQGKLILQQTMLNEANAFFQAGSRCAASFDLSPNVCNELSTPAIICYAYACELHLKLLNDLSQGTYEGGHCLDKLFNTLPDPVKAIASELYAAGNIATTLADFTAVLAELSNAFVDLRYWNEQERMLWPTPVEIKRIATVFHRTIRQLYPNLLVTFENRPLPY